VARSVPEWIAGNDNTSLPDRVKLRILDHYQRCCAICHRAIFPWEKWGFDHIIALANGGSNREKNLQPLCASCHKKKTRSDLAIKSKITRTRKRHLGLRKAKGRPLPGTKASGIRKRFDGTVERR